MRKEENILLFLLFGKNLKQLYLTFSLHLGLQIFGGVLFQPKTGYCKVCLDMEAKSGISAYVELLSHKELCTERYKNSVTPEMILPSYFQRIQKADQTND